MVLGPDRYPPFCYLYFGSGYSASPYRQPREAEKQLSSHKHQVPMSAIYDFQSSLFTLSLLCFLIPCAEPSAG